MMYNVFSKIIIILFLLVFASILQAGEVRHIGNEELKNFMQERVAIIDVRTTSEWKKTGVIEGSHLIMFYDEKGQYDLNLWLDKLNQVVEKDEPVILICHSGSRSKQLAKYLVKAVGYEVVINVKKGIHHWLKKGNKVQRYE